jgi:hypothetical protein
MGLRQKIPAIVAIHIGRNESPENLDQGFRHGFTIDFADWAGLHAYLPHPDHQRVGAALVAAAQGGLDGLIVFDLPFDGPAS